LRATAIGETQKPSIQTIRDRQLEGEQCQAPVRRKRRIFLDGEYREAIVIERNDLTWGHVFSGPAIVEQYDTTTFVPGGFECRVDGFGMIIGEWKEQT
jgi:N-methylhydantoinase A